MIFRFSLYGFLKNLQFFDPFLILFFLSIGLTYLEIGTLIAIRSILINLFEIPSGAIADLYGKKNAMIFSLSSYIISFAFFSFALNFAILVCAIFFFSIGEAFRTGTHKAMIFDWLKKNNRLDEKTKIYGYTRSWSKRGSAISVLISSFIVLFSDSYRWIFIFSIIPYLLGILNIFFYPSYLNNRKLDGAISISHIFSHLIESFKKVVKIKELRSLIVLSMGFESAFRVSKDYLQPILKSQAIIFASIFMVEEKESLAILVGVIYFILYNLSASASKSSYKVANFFGSEKKAIKFILISSFIFLLSSSVGVYYKIYLISILGFVLFFIIQNVWRPILVSLFDQFSGDGDQATILSIESQSKSGGVLILAPIIGYVADSFGISWALLVSAFLLLITLFFGNNRKKL